MRETFVAVGRPKDVRLAKFTLHSRRLQQENSKMISRHWTYLQNIATRRSGGISLFSRSCRILSLLVLFVCAFAGASLTANACSCGPKPTVLDSYEDSDVVIIGRVISVEKAEDTQKENYVDGVRSTTLVVEKVYKGTLKVRDEIVFGQGGGADCIWTFDEQSIGVQFLFYLRTPERFADAPYLPSRAPGQWFAFGCGRSGGLRGAADDLLYLDNLAKVRGKTRISGEIGGWQNPELNVDGKTIRIIGEKKTYETRTNAAGVFQIYDLPPGKYLIEPEMPPGWKIDPFWTRSSPGNPGDEFGASRLESPKQVPLLLEPKRHAAVEIVFAMDNVARGMVMDPKGKPMPGVCVYLLAPGRDKWGPHDCTDEKGRFEITSVPQGEYVLVANQEGKLSEREPFQRLYYPNVSERERAAVITIGPGDTINDLNIVVPKLEETITVEGVLRYSDGKPVAEEWVKFKAISTDESISGDVNAKTDAAGRFSLKILKGLTGELVAEDWLLEGLYKNCPKVDELLKESGKNNTTVYSNTIKLETKQNLYDIELALPFPRCEKAKD